MTQTNIILVEDDLRLASLISTFLTSEGFAVSHEARGDNAVALITDSKPDLVILDMNLPGLNGLEVCKEIRRSYRGAVIMVTANDDELTEVSALNFGVDDFIAKPIRPHVLLARINALFRRSQQNITAEPEHRLRIQDIVLDKQNRQVMQDQQTVTLSDAEFDVLAVLMENAGQILSRSQLFYAVRGIEYDGLDRSLDMRISSLRKQLNDLKAPHKYIKSVRGKGYLFITQNRNS
ncbi:response regulator transcription factor [Thalassomonas actiniarum]|uniref:Response regulator transcription factor n=1 Tax=Thalassomonas actiniarum TaxID=485447 RepID=A0AAE9YSA6_9GAMM|nr:response regulator transcription factor [Thalassomonas actiniarum]WDE00311.1 response regulator transcription factor [Thalassomonas actiniarum]